MMRTFFVSLLTTFCHPEERSICELCLRRLADASFLSMAVELVISFLLPHRLRIYRQAFMPFGIYRLYREEIVIL